MKEHRHTHRTKDYADKIAADASRAATEAKNAAISAQNTANSAASAAATAEGIAKGKTEKIPFMATLLAVNWSGNAAPYTQSVAMAGVMEEDEPHWDVVLYGDASQKLTLLEGYACVSELDTAKDSVTFTCLEEKPCVDLTIRMEVFR